MGAWLERSSKCFASSPRWPRHWVKSLSWVKESMTIPESLPCGSAQHSWRVPGPHKEAVNAASWTFLRNTQSPVLLQQFVLASLSPWPLLRKWSRHQAGSTRFMALGVCREMGSSWAEGAPLAPFWSLVFIYRVIITLDKQQPLGLINKSFLAPCPFVKSHKLNLHPYISKEQIST